MFLKNIKLANFRNYSEVELKFDCPITVLVGNNAQGKSNFLEAIYFLSTTKSPKADKDEELIKKGESVVRVEGVIENTDSQTNLEIAMQLQDESLGNGIIKKVKVNGIARRVLDYIGNLAVVIFSPEDINLVTGSPALRRWHIDLTLAQIDKEYKKALTTYGEVVTSKNRLLKHIKEGNAKVDELTYWSNQQLSLGQVVSQKRTDFFEFLNKTEKKFNSFLFEYLGNELTEKRLLEYQSREIAACASLIGPHRDDFDFVVGNRLGDPFSRSLRHFGSRGEHRTAVLDLKIAEVAFVEHVLGTRPVLLLDDVFSELDLAHRQHVLKLIDLQQTVIATVELDDYLKQSLKNAAILSVENGQLS